MTRRLCARDPELRVVMVTMHGNPALVSRAVRAGASAYLTKDFSMQEVVSAVRRSPPATSCCHATWRARCSES
jgi:DNA-binding NarL/FixJ family response regulator